MADHYRLYKDHRPAHEHKPSGHITVELDIEVMETMKLRRGDHLIVPVSMDLHPTSQMTLRDGSGR